MHIRSAYPNNLTQETKMKRLFSTLAAVAALAFTATIASSTTAQDILIDVSITPVYEISAPVDGVAAVPGIPSTQKDWYKAPVATTKDAALWSNQCWTSDSKTRKTAGTQGPEGVCIWNNGSLS